MTQTIGSIVQSVSAGNASARTVMAGALARIAAYDKVQPQAWISRKPDAMLLAMAEAIDARIATGQALPLAGVPFAVKDNIDVAGLPTTAASPGFAYDPANSAHVVHRLEAAGAICVGKTNLDQFATGLNGTRSPYGVPHCVFSREHISGGSSSGSAVVVAAGLVPFALGTDTAGSGRVPAAINGCIGFKPSRGRWSTSGLLPACRSLDCISVFATDIGDAALIDEVVRGFDAADAFSADRPDLPLFGQAPRIGVPQAAQLEFFGDPESDALFQAARHRAEAMGVVLVEVDIAPLQEAATLLYSGPWVAERTAAVGAFIEGNPDAVHPVVAAIIKDGQRYSAVDAFEGIYALQSLMRRTAAIWESVDALLLPTTATVYRIDQLLTDPFALNGRMGHYTAATNLLDLAAIALPAGYRANGTGFGISFLGPSSADTALLELGERFMGAGTDSKPPLDPGDVVDRVALAVVGAHLDGMPLHWELATRDARLVAKTRTAPSYRLYAIADSIPPKPALVHVGDGGVAIEVEVYDLPIGAFGSFVANVPPPLAIGTLTLEGGTNVKGFVAEPRAIDNARDISEFGGWANYLRHLN